MISHLHAQCKCYWLIMICTYNWTEEVSDSTILRKTKNLSWNKIFSSGLLFSIIFVPNLNNFSWKIGPGTKFSPEQNFHDIFSIVYLDDQGKGRMWGVSTGIYKFDSMARGQHIYKTVWLYPLMKPCKCIMEEILMNLTYMLYIIANSIFVKNECIVDTSLDMLPTMHQGRNQ